MTRIRRFLGNVKSTSSTSGAAEPPEAVAVESDYVVILAALLCALICVVGLMAVARCAWLRRSTARNVARSRSCSAAPNRGLKKKILQSLPTFTYDTAADAKPSGADCAICLSDYAEGDEIRVLPQCGHGFHVACIDKWLGSHSSCPSCRQILARCHNCGEFPAVSGGGAGAGAGAEAEVKAREDAYPSSDFLPC